MKKFGKFLTGTAVLAGLAAGAYYVYKNFFEESEDFDEDDDISLEEENEEPEAEKASDREYISININEPKAVDEEG